MKNRQRWPARCALSAALSATLALGLCGGAAAATSFVNGLAIPATTGDLFGTSVNDGRLGFFSDIYYDRGRNEWWGLSDRGPGGGTISYETRVQRFTLDVNPDTGAISNFQIAATLKFYNGSSALNGLSPSPTSVLGNTFDPEGIVVNPLNGNLLVSDEYGPSLYEFNRAGQRVRQFNTPANLLPRNAGTGTPNFASDAGNDAGKRTNRGFEGLAVSPDGKFSYAMLQSAMLDEGAGNGVYNRIVKFDNATGNAVAQYAYKMEGSSQGRGISALVAINDHEFLVLERNNRGVGVDAELTPANKKVFRIDLTGASDVSALDLDAPGASFTAVGKNTTPLVDLAANTPFLGGRSPEKWEGLAVGPKLNDGSYLLLAGTDNDYSITQNGTGTQYEVLFNGSTGVRIVCDIGSLTNCLTVPASGGGGTTPFTGSFDGFAPIPGILHAYKSDIAGFTAPVPEPESWAMMVAGLAMLGHMARRRKPQAGAVQGARIELK